MVTGIANSSPIIEYLENLKPIFQIIKECEEGRDIMGLLEGPIAHNGFNVSSICSPVCNPKPSSLKDEERVF